MNNRSGQISTSEILFYVLGVNKGRTRQSLILLLGGLLVLGWGGNAIYTFFGMLIRGVYGLITPHRFVDHWTDSFIAASIDLLVAAVFFVVIYYFMRRHILAISNPPRGAAFKTPEPHAGLILSLSPFNRNCRFKSVDEIDVNATDAKNELTNSNWGPLVVASEHHGDKLKHCWVVCSRQVLNEYPKAEELIKRFAPHVKCHKRNIVNINDVVEMVGLTDEIYKDASEKGLPAEFVIADFTSGTAMMSGGLIISAASKNRKLEYMKQDGTTKNESLIEVEIPPSLLMLKTSETIQQGTVI